MSSTVRRRRVSRAPVPRRHRRWPAVVAVAGVVAVTAAAVYAASPRGGGNRPDAQAWDRKAQTAFAELVDRTPKLVSDARDWLAGQVPTEQFESTVDSALAAFVQAQRHLRSLDTPGAFSETRSLYEDAAQLYEETARVYWVAARTGAGDLRTQLDLLARRLRLLGDRVFDRGRALLGIEETQSSDIEITRPPQVPVWTDEGLATGPPLDVPPPPRPATPPLSEPPRRQAPASTWGREVRGAGVPSEAQLARAIQGGNGSPLQSLARRFDAAAARLQGGSDPKGLPDKGTLVRLSVLAGADAARAAQAATLTGDGRLASLLTKVAERLALVSDSVWPTEAGARRSGFSTGLLEDTGP